MTMATGQNKHSVTIRLEFGEFCVPEVLEDFTVEALDAIQSYAGDVALGPIVAVDLAPASVDIDFSVLVTTLSELQQAVAKVVNVLEQHADLGSVMGSSVEQRPVVPVAPAAEQRPLACV